MSALATVDLVGVEVFAAGGPFHGRNSPPSGDRWTRRELEEIAAANRELAGELKPPAKIGHDSGAPAVGWLEGLHLNPEGTKLLADIKRVPRQLAELIRAGAYRTRSVELSKVTSQTTGKVYPWAVSGMAFLGGQVPAVRTLADVTRLYSGEGSVEVRRVYELDAQPDAQSEIERQFEAELAHKLGVTVEELI